MTLYEVVVATDSAISDAFSLFGLIIRRLLIWFCFFVFICECVLCVKELFKMFRNGRIQYMLR
jgi:hypothetical protein